MAPGRQTDHKRLYLSRSRHPLRESCGHHLWQGGRLSAEGRSPQHQLGLLQQSQHPRQGTSLGDGHRCGIPLVHQEGEDQAGIQELRRKGGSSAAGSGRPASPMAPGAASSRSRAQGSGTRGWRTAALLQLLVQRRHQLLANGETAPHAVLEDERVGVRPPSAHRPKASSSSARVPHSSASGCSTAVALEEGSGLRTWATGEG